MAGSDKSKKYNNLVSNNKKGQIMKPVNKRTPEDLIQEGIRQIQAGMRILPDEDLYDRISRIADHTINQSLVPEIADNASLYTLRRTIVKLGWSVTAAAAAIFAGIMVGNIYFSEESTTEKDAYKQEITMQSSDISGLSAELINYYNEDNP